MCVLPETRKRFWGNGLILQTTTHSARQCVGFFIKKIMQIAMKGAW